MLANLIWIGLTYVIVRTVFQILLKSWIPMVKLLGSIMIGVAIVSALSPILNIFIKTSDDFHQFVGTYTGVKTKVESTYDTVTGLPEKLEEIPIVGEGATKYPPAKGLKETIWPWSKKFFDYPVKGEITQAFDGKEHHGIDIACEEVPIKSARDGTVDLVGQNEIYGNYVILGHGGQWQTLYAHLGKIFVKKGQHVFNQENIGIASSTGKSTGVHLHFEIRVGGKTIDPKSWMK